MNFTENKLITECLIEMASKENFNFICKYIKFTENNIIIVLRSLNFLQRSQPISLQL